MGQLLYGSISPAIVVDDQILQYIQVVTATKLRRLESFALTWVHPEGTGRETLWMQPAIPMRFIFDRAESEKLDMSRLRELLDAASSSAGLTLDPRTWDQPEASHLPRLVAAA